MMYDVITLGETMLRLTPPGHLRIEQTQSYEVHIGGSESNVAVGLARLGLRVSWVSRMTNNSPGRSVVNAIRAYGVDTSHVVWTDEDRVGLYFFEAGVAPRGGKVIYDRAGSAMSKMQPAELPASLFALDAARLLHLSGITLAIGEAAAQTTLKAAQQAKANGYLLSFDLNYRQLLWSYEQARAAYDELASLADILFLPLRDAVSIYGTANEATEAVTALHTRYPQATVVMTLSAEGAIARDADLTAQQGVIPAQPIGRLGGGDAFVAGYLYAHLAGKPLAERLRWGTASAAYKYSILGDMPLLDYEAIAQLVQDENGQGFIR